MYIKLYIIKTLFPLFFYLYNNNKKIIIKKKLPSESTSESSDLAEASDADSESDPYCCIFSIKILLHIKFKKKS